MKKFYTLLILLLLQFVLSGNSLLAEELKTFISQDQIYSLKYPNSFELDINKEDNNLTLSNNEMLLKVLLSRFNAMHDQPVFIKETIDNMEKGSFKLSAKENIVINTLKADHLIFNKLEGNINISCGIIIINIKTSTFLIVISTTSNLYNTNLLKVKTIIESINVN